MYVKKCVTPQKIDQEYESDQKTPNSWSHINAAVWMRGCNKPEDKKSSCKGGAGEYVEEAEAEEGNDVLDVVEVSAPDSLYVFIQPSLGGDEAVEVRLKI